MPSITFDSIFSFIGVLSLLAGFFLIITGLGVVEVEKITVMSGPKTWGFGIFLLIIGIVFLWSEIQSSAPQVNFPTPTATAIVLASTETSQPNQQAKCDTLKLDAIDPPAILENESREYKLIGSGFCNDTAIFISINAWVGNSPQSTNSQPIEVSSDGTWLTVYIHPVSQPDQSGAHITVENPDGNTTSLYVNYQR